MNFYITHLRSFAGLLLFLFSAFGCNEVGDLASDQLSKDDARNIRNTVGTGDVRLATQCDDWGSAVESGYKLVSGLNEASAFVSVDGTLDHLIVSNASSALEGDQSLAHGIYLQKDGKASLLNLETGDRDTPLFDVEAMTISDCAVGSCLALIDGSENDGFWMFVYDMAEMIPGAGIVPLEAKKLDFLDTTTQVVNGMFAHRDGLKLTGDDDIRIIATQKEDKCTNSEYAKNHPKECQDLASASLTQDSVVPDEVRASISGVNGDTQGYLPLEFLAVNTAQYMINKEDSEEEYKRIAAYLSVLRKHFANADEETKTKVDQLITSLLGLLSRSFTDDGKSSIEIDNEINAISEKVSSLNMVSMMEQLNFRTGSWLGLVFPRDMVKIPGKNAIAILTMGGIVELYFKDGIDLSSATLPSSFDFASQLGSMYDFTIIPFGDIIMPQPEGLIAGEGKYYIVGERAHNIISSAEGMLVDENGMSLTYDGEIHEISCQTN